MESQKFSEKYWSEMKPLVNSMISNAPKHPNKSEYVKDCWSKLEIELRKYELSELDFRDVNSKLRKEIEDKILK